MNPTVCSFLSALPKLTLLTVTHNYLACSRHFSSSSSVLSLLWQGTPNRNSKTNLERKSMGPPWSLVRRGSPYTPSRHPRKREVTFGLISKNPDRLRGPSSVLRCASTRTAALCGILGYPWSSVVPCGTMHPANASMSQSEVE